MSVLDNLDLYEDPDRVIATMTKLEALANDLAMALRGAISFVDNEDVVTVAKYHLQKFEEFKDVQRRSADRGEDQEV